MPSLAPTSILYRWWAWLMPGPAGQEQNISRITAKLNTVTSTEGTSIPTEAPEPIDTRRGTIVGDNNATISSEDSKESGGGLKMLDAVETILYQQNTSLVRPSTRPRDLKLNKEQRHDKLGHFGTHKNCIHCQQVKQRPRQVYKYLPVVTIGKYRDS